MLLASVFGLVSVSGFSVSAAETMGPGAGCLTETSAVSPASLRDCHQPALKALVGSFSNGDRVLTVPATQDLSGWIMKVSMCESERVCVRTHVCARMRMCAVPFPS